MTAEELDEWGADFLAFLRLFSLMCLAARSRGRRPPSTCGGCWRRCRARMAGSWRKRWATRMPDADATPAVPDAVAADSARDIAAKVHRLRSLVTKMGSASWTRPASSRRASARWASNGSTAGTAGKIENCQIGTFLSYATGKGHVFLDRRLYLPEEWCERSPSAGSRPKCLRTWSSRPSPSRPWRCWSMPGKRACPCAG